MTHPEYWTGNWCPPQRFPNRPTDAIKTTPIIFDATLTALLHKDLLDIGARVFRMGLCRIIISDEQQGWHLSISCAKRDPTWQEIATARYRLLGAVREMVMFLPPLDEYVNLHPHTFHLHEYRHADQHSSK